MIKPSMVNGVPTVNQPACNGWDISYNPDDGRWYVCKPDADWPGELVTVATFKKRRNAMTYARNHQTH